MLYKDYGECLKISYTKVSDKMEYANSVDPNQTAPSGSTLYVILLFFKKQLH